MVGRVSPTRSPTRKRADDEDSVSSFGVGPDGGKVLGKLAWTGNCAVDHEAYQRMVEEHRQAKKQQALLELKTKQLAAQLARTEEAAKRALLRTDTTAKGGAAQRLLDAERLAQKLKEENADLASKLAREKKRCVDFKARAVEFEGRLTAALKEQRRLVARLGAEERGNVTNIRKKREEEYWSEEAGRRFREQQELLAKLRDENERLHAQLEGQGGDEVTQLQNEVDELRRQLDYFQNNYQASQDVGPGAPAAPGEPPIGPDDWVLEDVEHDGQAYLLDKQTFKLFTYGGTGQWPRPAGCRSKDGSYSLGSKSMLNRLLEGLDSYLKDNRQRLADVFHSFDRDGSGMLDRRELGAMLRVLTPDMSGSESEAVQQLLDVDGDGGVSLDELMTTIKDLMAAGDAAKRGRAVDINGVLQRVRAALRERRKDVTAMFDVLDRDHDHCLTFAEASELVREFVPGLTAKELRYLLIKLHFWDVKGEGRTQLQDLYACLELLTVRRQQQPNKGAASGSPGGYIAAARPGSPMRASMAASEFGSPTGGYKAATAGMQEMYLRERVVQLQAELAEAHKKEASLTGDATQVPMLRSELSKAQGRVQQLETDFLLFDPARLPEMSDYDSQMKLIRQQLLAFKRRYMEDHAELNSLKAAHERAVKALDTATKEKVEESRVRYALEDELVGLRATAQRISDLELRIEKEREEKATLYRQMLEEQAKALRAPSSALDQVRVLQRQLVDLEGKKADAESREAEWRGQVGRLEVQLSQVSPERLHRAERELAEARMELARKQTRLEEMENRLQVFNRIKDASSIPVELNMPNVILPQAPGKPQFQESRMKPAADNGARQRTLDAGKPDDSKGEVEMRAELMQLREAYNADLRELDKLRKVLQHEEDIANEAHAALEVLRRQKDEDADELKKELASLRREIDRRDERIHKLELQLRGAYTGISKAVRSSMARVSYATEDANDLSELGPNENIFELLLDEATFKESEIGADASTFFTVDFYLHETQATQVVGGLHPKFETTIQYIISVSEDDPMFLEYMDTSVLELELHAAQGWDYRQIGLARIRLRSLLDDVELGARVGHHQYHHADIFGASGRAIGSLRFGVSFRRPLERALRHYRTLAGSQQPLTLDPRDPIVDAVRKAEESQGISSYIRVFIDQASRLQHADGSRVMSPYIYYRFPGHALPRNTVLGVGSDPMFGDEALLAMARTKEAEVALGRREVAMMVWDDAAGEDAKRSLVGVATVPLANLSTGLQVYDNFRVIHPGTNKVCGTVLASVSWFNPLQAAAGATGAPLPLPQDTSPAASMVLKETTPLRGRDAGRPENPSRFREEAEAGEYERLQRQRSDEERQVQQQGRDLQRRMDARPQPAAPAQAAGRGRQSSLGTATEQRRGEQRQGGRETEVSPDQYGLGQQLSFDRRRSDEPPQQQQQFGLMAEDEPGRGGGAQRTGSGQRQAPSQPRQQQQQEFGLMAEGDDERSAPPPPPQRINTGQRTAAQQPRQQEEFGLGAEPEVKRGRDLDPASPSREASFGLASEAGEPAPTETPAKKEGPARRQQQGGAARQQEGGRPARQPQQPQLGLFAEMEESIPSTPNIKLMSSTGSGRQRYSDVDESVELQVEQCPRRISPDHSNWSNYDQQLIIKVEELALARSPREDLSTRSFVIEHSMLPDTAEAARLSARELRCTDPVPNRAGTIYVDQAFAYRVVRGQREVTPWGAALKRQLASGRSCLMRVVLMSGKGTDTSGMRVIGEGSLNMTPFWEGQEPDGPVGVEIFDKNGDAVGTVGLRLVVDEAFKSLYSAK